MARRTGSDSDRTIVIDPRFAAFELGEDGFAVGGYTCGVVTRGWHSATVRLRRPTPVGVPLVLEDTGERRTLLSDEEAVAIADTHEPITGPTSAVSFADSTEAARSYPGLLPENPAPRCFVCGPEREEGEGLRI